MTQIPTPQQTRWRRSFSKRTGENVVVDDENDKNDDFFINRREYEKRVKACVEQSWVDCDE